LRARSADVAHELRSADSQAQTVRYQGRNSISVNETPVVWP
jgi:hypothetical protein